jgi:Na+-translocating ferredoxin:NAD+ oxidoreductase RnfG subunit
MRWKFFIFFFLLRVSLEAEVLLTQEKALQLTLPEAEEVIEEIKELNEEQKAFLRKKWRWRIKKSKFKFFRGVKDGRTIRTAFIIKQKGKHGPLWLIIALEPAGKVADVRLMALIEQRGKPVKNRKFLKQFFGKTIKAPLQIGKDIKAVTKATTSSRAVAIAVKKAVILYYVLYLYSPPSNKEKKE